jgi:hypothetical protein
MAARATLISSAPGFIKARRLASPRSRPRWKVRSSMDPRRDASGEVTEKQGFHMLP